MSPVSASASISGSTIVCVQRPLDSSFESSPRRARTRPRHARSLVRCRSSAASYRPHAPRGGAALRQVVQLALSLDVCGVAVGVHGRVIRRAVDAATSRRSNHRPSLGDVKPRTPRNAAARGDPARSTRPPRRSPMPTGRDHEHDQRPRVKTATMLRRPRPRPRRRARAASATTKPSPRSPPARPSRPQRLRPSRSRCS